jgi:hypothetical protein
VNETLDKIHKLATDGLLDGDLEPALREIRSLCEPLTVGDKVRLGDIRPKYLCRLEGTIVSINDGGVRASVDIPHLNQFPRFSNPLCVPVSCLERV